MSRTRHQSSILPTRGAASVSFVLAMPLFIFMLGLFAQLSLMAHARLIVQHAADAAGRSAVVSLCEERPDAVRNSALVVLSGLCAPDGNPGDIHQHLAETINDGRWVSRRLARQLACADESTRVETNSAGWFDSGFKRSLSREVTVTVHHRFRLDVPLVSSLVGYQGSINGRSGRFVELSASSRVITSPGVDAAWDFRPGGPLMSLWEE